MWFVCRCVCGVLCAGAALITNEPLRAGQQFVVKADDEGSFHGGGFLLVPVTIPVAPVAPVPPVVPVAPVTPAALVAVPVGLGGTFLLRSTVPPLHGSARFVVTLC